VAKNVNTPWKPHGIPCGIIHGITIEHNGCPWIFHVFGIYGIFVEAFTWNLRGRFSIASFPWNSMKHKYLFCRIAVGVYLPL